MTEVDVLVHSFSIQLSHAKQIEKVVLSLLSVLNYCLQVLNASPGETDSCDTMDKTANSKGKHFIS